MAATVIRRDERSASAYVQAVTAPRDDSTVTCPTDVLNALASGQFGKLSLKPGTSIAEQSKETAERASASPATRPLEQKKMDATQLGAEIDKRVEEIAKDDLPASRTHSTSGFRFPAFAKYLPEQNKIYVIGTAIDDPFLCQLYEKFSQQLSARSPQVAIFLPGSFSNEEGQKKESDFGESVRDERNSAYMSVSMGWFCATLVRTPMLYILLQGPHDKPRTPEERNCAESPIYASTTFLVFYYRAIQLLLFDSYAQQDDETIRNRMLRALSDKRTVEQLLTTKTQASIHEAMLKIFADEEPKKYRITRERQRSKSTKEWVEIHRQPLEELGRKIRIWTIMRLQQHEATISTLLGLPGDADMQRTLLCSLDSLRPDEIMTKHREFTCQHYLDAMRFMSLNYLSFPPKKKKDPTQDTFHYAEGEFLRNLLDAEGYAAIRDRELNTRIGDHTTSLAFLWIRLCSYTRLLDAQREFGEEYGK